MGTSTSSSWASTSTCGGIGRHLLGSQIYDYWADPGGGCTRHWSDTDRLNVKNGSNLLSAEEGLVSQWVRAAAEKFLKTAARSKETHAQHRHQPI